MFLSKIHLAAGFQEHVSPHSQMEMCGIFMLQPQKSHLMVFPMPCGAVTRFDKVQDRGTQIS